MKVDLDKLAKIISALSSPFITITVFGILGILAVPHSFSQALIRIVLFLLFIIVVPLIYILVGMRMGKITDLHVTLREQRPVTFVAATIGSIALLISYLVLSVPKSLISLSAAVTVCGVLFGLISSYWKISVHAAAYSTGVLILWLVNQQGGVLLLELGLPLVIWARLKRRKHDPWQALGGAIVACVCVYAVFKLVSAI